MSWGLAAVGVSKATPDNPLKQHLEALSKGIQVLDNAPAVAPQRVADQIKYKIRYQVPLANRRLDPASRPRSHDFPCAGATARS